MAKETTKTTTPLQSACEQYVVDELKQTKQELLKKDNVIKELQSINEVLSKKHNSLLDLLKGALSTGRIEETENYTYVYFGEYNFVGLFDTNEPSEEDKWLVLLAELIKKVNRTPEREK